MSFIEDHDRSAEIWYAKYRERGAEPPPPAPASDAASEPPLAVRVELFGILATLTSSRALTLQLPAKASVGDVIASLRARFGDELFDHVYKAQGTLNGCCRVFIDGCPTDDLEAPLARGAGSPTVEVILLTPAEGG